jgi:hypothetical protein
MVQVIKTVITVTITAELSVSKAITVSGKNIKINVTI